jgi:hypothetical protein
MLTRPSYLGCFFRNLPPLLWCELGSPGLPAFLATKPSGSGMTLFWFCHRLWLWRDLTRGFVHNSLGELGHITGALRSLTWFHVLKHTKAIERRQTQSDSN